MTMTKEEYEIANAHPKAKILRHAGAPGGDWVTADLVNGRIDTSDVYDAGRLATGQVRYEGRFGGRVGFDGLPK